MIPAPASKPGAGGALLDTCYGIETPEGIDIELRPAGIAARMLAYLVDLLIRGLVLLAAGIALQFFGMFGGGLMLILLFLLEWFYPLFFEVLRQGMTPGKQAIGIRVVHEDGTPVGWNGSLIRNLLRAADFLPLLYCAGIVSMALERDFKRLGDIAAGTVVVYNHEAARPAQARAPGSRPAPVALSGEEQRALLGFAERRHKLSAQRQRELADILAPLTGSAGPENADELARIANGLTGAE